MLRLFSTPQPLTVWRKVSTQSYVTSSSSSSSLLHSLLISAGVEIFPGLYNFPDAHTVLIVTPTTYALHVDTLPVKHATHATYAAFPLGHQPVYFRKQVYILLGYPHNLWGMSKGSFRSLFNTWSMTVYKSLLCIWCCFDKVLFRLAGEMADAVDVLVIQIYWLVWISLYFLLIVVSLYPEYSYTVEF